MRHIGPARRQVLTPPDEYILHSRGMSLTGPAPFGPSLFLSLFRLAAELCLLDGWRARASSPSPPDSKASWGT
eukprot:1575507-Pyramimonas_sp.AAC.1